METWLRNTTETDFMITCNSNHVSADGQLDSGASGQAGAVNSERLSEGGGRREKIGFIVLHCVHVQTSLDRLCLMCYFLFPAYK